MGIRQEANAFDSGSLAAPSRLRTCLRVHGLPLPSYCTHGTLLFLPWHRAYLYCFERALEDLDLSAGLPQSELTSPSRPVSACLRPTGAHAGA